MLGGWVGWFRRLIAWNLRRRIRQRVAGQILIYDTSCDEYKAKTMYHVARGENIYHQYKPGSENDERKGAPYIEDNA